MEYVKRSCCPKELSENQLLWTQPWLTYYHRPKKAEIEGFTIKKPNKPSDGHWR
ncbi:MAG: hypothetical protein ACI8WB_005796, partial [Phenylobacterium sp.]